MISSSVKNPQTGVFWQITKEGSAEVVVHSHPPLTTKVDTLPFFQYMTDDGTVTGDNDMIVNGATTNVDFTIASSQTKDIFISFLSFRISDAGASLNEFGGLGTALTNGCQLFYDTSETGEVQISEDITTNIQLIRLGGGEPAFGSGSNAFLADASGGGEDTYLPVIDFSRIFRLDYGLRLRKGTNDKIGFRIRDNLAGLIEFNVFACGLTVSVNGS